jgi:hypothetical protein
MWISIKIKIKTPSLDTPKILCLMQVFKNITLNWGHIVKLCNGQSCESMDARCLNAFRIKFFLPKSKIIP